MDSWVPQIYALISRLAVARPSCIDESQKVFFFTRWFGDTGGDTDQLLYACWTSNGLAYLACLGYGEQFEKFRVSSIQQQKPPYHSEQVLQYTSKLFWYMSQDRNMPTQPLVCIAANY